MLSAYFCSCFGRWVWDTALRHSSAPRMKHTTGSLSLFFFFFFAEDRHKPTEIPVYSTLYNTCRSTFLAVQHCHGGSGCAAAHKCRLDCYAQDRLQDTGFVLRSCPALSFWAGDTISHLLPMSSTGQGLAVQFGLFQESPREDGGTHKLVFSTSQ